MTYPHHALIKTKAQALEHATALARFAHVWRTAGRELVAHDCDREREALLTLAEALSDIARGGKVDL